MINLFKKQKAREERQPVKSFIALGVIFLVLLLFSFSFSSAETFGYGKTEKIPTNYSLIPTVNNSQYLQGLTPSQVAGLASISSTCPSGYVAQNISNNVFQCVALSLGTYNSTYDVTSKDVTANRSDWFSTYNVTYAGLINNASYLSTYNVTYAGNLGNSSWNQTLGDYRYILNTNDLNTSGLVSFWKFDESGGALISAQDSIGTNSLTTVSPAIFSSGKIGNALSSAMGYARNITPSSNIKITEDITIEAWIKEDVTPADPINYIFRVYNYTPYTTKYALGIDSSNRLVFYWGTAIAATSSPIGLGSWYHVVAVKSANSYSIYINGVLNITGSATTSPIYNSNDQIYAGKMGTGLTDELRIYNRSLSASEIYNNYIYNTINVYPKFTVRNVNIGDSLNVTNSIRTKDLTVSGLFQPNAVSSYYYSIMGNYLPSGGGGRGTTRYYNNFAINGIHYTTTSNNNSLVGGLYLANYNIIANSTQTTFINYSYGMYSYNLIGRYEQELFNGTIGEMVGINSRQDLSTSLGTVNNFYLFKGEISNYTYSSVNYSYGLYLPKIDMSGNNSYSIYSAGGNAYIQDNISADNFIDHTPGWSSTSKEALNEITSIKYKDTATGSKEVDHSTLPDFAKGTYNEEVLTNCKVVCYNQTDYLSKEKGTNQSLICINECDKTIVSKDGRNIGAMITMLTESAKALNQENINLKSNLTSMQNTINKLCALAPKGTC